MMAKQRKRVREAVLSGLENGREQLSRRTWQQLDVARDVLKCKRSELKRAIRERWCGDASDWCRLHLGDMPEPVFMLLVQAAQQQGQLNPETIGDDVLQFWKEWVEGDIQTVERYTRTFAERLRSFMGKYQEGVPLKKCSYLLDDAARYAGFARSAALQAHRTLELLRARCSSWSMS
jgi:hypothetical protein